MTTEPIPIEFNGYWRDVDQRGLPARSGIYVVYECAYNPSEDSVCIHKLIYIGEAENVNNRVTCHEKRKDWLRYVNQDNELCFSFGDLDENNRIRAEAALIFEHQPPVNIEYKQAFPFDPTTISLTGKISLLNACFTVYRT